MQVSTRLTEIVPSSHVKISYDVYFRSESSLPLAKCHLEFFCDKVDTRNSSSIMRSSGTPFRNTVRPSCPPTQKVSLVETNLRLFMILVITQNEKIFISKPNLLYFLSLVKKMREIVPRDIKKIRAVKGNLKI